MTARASSLTDDLRDALFRGAFAPHQHLGETDLAARFGVSRTLVRLAMGALEEEGLLIREPNRGCRVRAFTVQEVSDAIEVRGELEAMAARKAAERGLTAQLRERFARNLAETRDLLHAGVRDDASRSRWAQLNTEFHDSIIEASGNRALRPMARRLNLVPLASASAILFNRIDDIAGLSQLRLSLMDHQNVLEAIEARTGCRAGAIMREHAFRSALNKRRNLRARLNRDGAGFLPGIALVEHDEEGEDGRDPRGGHRKEEGGAAAPLAKEAGSV